MNMHTYSPILIPLNWQTELIHEDEYKLNVISDLLHERHDVTVNPCDFQIGYGSLDFDNLPLFYRPAAVIELLELSKATDVIEARLYCYENCLAILHINLQTSFDLGTVNDLSVSERISCLATEYLQPLLTFMYEQKTTGQLISPKAYKFYKDDKDAFCSGVPLWVARMLICADGLESAHYLNWLQNVDETSDMLLLGSGNSLLLDKNNRQDFHRVMLMSQFHSALMTRTETLLKETLTSFNACFFKKNTLDNLQDNVELHQYRNDHIEYINIQYSSASDGVQGKRRQLLAQFDKAWRVAEQKERLLQLAQLVQKRLDRFVHEKTRAQARSIQTLLAFLGALSLVALITDLANLSNDLSHTESIGLLDIFSLLSAEHILSITIFLVILFTFYFYRNHE